jgi:hypothetical protein
MQPQMARDHSGPTTKSNGSRSSRFSGPSLPSQGDRTPPGPHFTPGLWESRRVCLHYRVSEAGPPSRPHCPLLEFHRVPAAPADRIHGKYYKSTQTPALSDPSSKELFLWPTFAPQASFAQPFLEPRLRGHPGCTRHPSAQTQVLLSPRLTNQTTTEPKPAANARVKSQKIS